MERSSLPVHEMHRGMSRYPALRLVFNRLNEEARRLIFDQLIGDDGENSEYNFRTFICMLVHLLVYRGFVKEELLMLFSNRFHLCFINLGTIGEGGFGKVFKVCCKNDGEIYAMKRILFDTFDELDAVKEEVQIMAKFDSPYIARYHESWVEVNWDKFDKPPDCTHSESEDDDDDDASIYSGNDAEVTKSAYDTSVDSVVQFENNNDDGYKLLVDDKEDRKNDSGPSKPSEMTPNDRRVCEKCYVSKYCLYIRMKVYSRTLQELISDMDKTFVGTANGYKKAPTRLFHKIALGLQCIHRKGFIHADMHDKNILVEETDGGDICPKITDFGLARPNTKTVISPYFGVLPFRAPETRNGFIYQASDVYSLGVIAIKLLCKCTTGHGLLDYITKIKDGNPDIPFICDQRMVDLLRSMLCEGQDARPSIQEVVTMLEEIM